MLPARFRIVHYMVLSAVVALGLATWQVRLNPSSVFLLGVSLILPAGLAVLALLPWYGSRPLKMVFADPPDDPERHIEALERALAASPHARPGLVVRARYALLLLLKGSKRFEEAAHQGRRLLERRFLSVDFEAMVRLEIATCLDRLGRGDDAEEERARADEALDDRPSGAIGWAVQGELLDRQLRFAEASQAYGRALELRPAGEVAARNDLMMRLTLANFNAGRMEESLRWAGLLTAAEISPSLRIEADRLSGITAMGLDRLDEARRRLERAYGLAVESGGARVVASCLASLADLERQRGDLARAEELCGEAEALSPGSAREAIVTHASVLRSRGRLDEAVRRVEEAGRVGAIDHAFFECRMQSALKMYGSMFKAELGRLDEARADLAEAAAKLHQDPRMGPYCEAGRVWILALEGRHGEAVRDADRILADLEARMTDPSMCRDCLSLVGRGLFQAGDYERSGRCWAQYLAIDHPPLAGVLGWFHLGECHRHRGDRSRAAEAYERAASSGIDCHERHQAERRLRELRGIDLGPG